MNELDMNAVCDYVNKNIVHFHSARLEKLQSINLKGVLKKKNPYLFKAKNIQTAADLVQSILDAFISSSEEEMFGAFLEALAIFICDQAYGGKKSSTTGIDLEFFKESKRFLVSIKSGPNWGNSSQYKALEKNFRDAKKVLMQNRNSNIVQPVLGSCYGKAKTTDNGLYIKIAGQNFWYFISGNKELYVEIIEPIGYKAKQHNDHYEKEKSRVYNKFTQEFLNVFSHDGEIDWNALVQFNSGNFKDSDTQI